MSNVEGSGGLQTAVGGGGPMASVSGVPGPVCPQHPHHEARPRHPRLRCYPPGSGSGHHRNPPENCKHNPISQYLVQMDVQM